MNATDRATAAPAPSTEEPAVRTGLDRLPETGELLRGLSVGLIANPSSVDASFRHAREVVAALPGVRLAALFAPEHGFDAVEQDLVEIPDAGERLPVRSLYGPTRRPTKAMLEGLDALVFDLQDIGSRYYTYIWTMAHALEATAEHGKRLVVLDRPNPIGGAEEGNLIEDDHRSFVGLYPLPNRHGLTVGEIAGFLNREYRIGADLVVVGCRGLRRERWLDETGLPFVPPSPNMPTLDTAAVYPGACLLEGTLLSEGRGTTRPFETCGAPWVDGRRLAAALREEDLPGVAFRPVRFRPTFQKFAGEECGGVMQHLTDRRVYRPWRTGIALLAALRRLWPGEFRWRPPPYEYEAKRLPIDILAGSPRLREGIEAGRPAADLAAALEAERLENREFEESRRSARLYP